MKLLYTAILRHGQEIPHKVDLRIQQGKVKDTYLPRHIVLQKYSGHLI